MAGIGAAIACIRAGLKPIVVESTGYIGGRSRSFIEPVTGELIDNGQHLLMGCYNNVLDIATTLGTRHTLHMQKSLEVQFRDTQGSVDAFGPSRLPSSLGALSSLLRMRSLSLRSKLGALLMMTALRGGYVPSPSLTALDVLHSFHQTPQIIERFWEPFVLATMNAHVSRASGGVLVEVLKRSILAGGVNSSLVIPRSGLSAIVEPFADWLSRNGGELHMHENVEEIVVDQGRCVGVRLRSGALLDTDAAVLAVPPHAIERIQRSDTGSPIVSLHSSMRGTSAIVSTYMWFDKSFMTEPLCAGIGTTTQWVFNRRALHDAEPDVVSTYPGHITLTTSAAASVQDEDAESIVTRSLQEIHQLIPESRTARMLHSKVIKERRATMVLTPEAQEHRPTWKTEISNVVCCGDWTQTRLPATLEGAAESGIRAVNGLAKGLGSI